MLRLLTAECFCLQQGACGVGEGSQMCPGRTIPRPVPRSARCVPPRLPSSHLASAALRTPRVALIASLAGLPLLIYRSWSDRILVAVAGPRLPRFYRFPFRSPGYVGLIHGHPSCRRLLEPTTKMRSRQRLPRSHVGLIHTAATEVAITVIG